VKSTRTSRAALLSAALLILCLPTLARPARSDGETLESLLRKHIRATATPAALRDLRSQKTVYQLNAAGMTGTLIEYDALPHRMRVEMALGPIRQTSADNGRVAWEQDMTGHVRFLGGPELAEDRATESFSLEGYDPFRSKERGRVALRPRREPGTGDYILELSPTGGMRQTAYLDPHTYLLRKVVASKAGITGTVSILAYKQIGGEQVPSQLEITYAGLPVVVSATLLSAQRGLHFSPALFDPPATARDFQFLTPTGRGPASIPFSDDHGEIIVPVTVNGQPRRLLLDSGAGNSFLTGNGSQGLNLATVGSVPAVGYGGAARTGIATHATLELPGAVRVQGQTLYVVQDPGIARALQARGGIDGALGYDLFSRFAVTIDYQKKTLTLADPAGAPAQTDDLSVPLRLETRTPSVAAAVDGKKPGRFLIDTGDSGAVHLFQKYARANGLLPAADDPNAQTVEGLGIGGVIKEIVTPDHRLTLGGLTLTQVPLAAIGGGGITDVLDQAGGIGNAVLRKFVVTFDYAHSRLRLRKAPGFTPSLGSGPVNPSAPSAPPSTPPAPNSGGAGQGMAHHAPTGQGMAHHAPTRSFCPTPRLTRDELLRRHLEALGGEAAVEAITSTRVTANVETGGIKGTVITVFAVPDKEFEEDKLGILDIEQGYDGKTAWRRDTNGNIRPLGSDETKNLRNQLFFDTNSYVIPGRIPGKITLRPQTDPATGDFVLDALPEGGKPTTLFLDPKTFLIVKEQHNDDNVLVSTTYGDYRTVDGVRFPFAQHTTNGNTRYDIVLKVITTENNVKVADSLFQRPAQSGQFAFVTPGATSATVPFDFDDGEIALSVTVNGRPGRVFLDSGASGIALSKATADALKLPQAGFLEARGYGGSADLLPVKVHTFEIPGAVRLSDVAAVAIPLPPALNSFLTQPIAGFVGYDLLSHFVTRIDFPKRQITFIAPDTFLATPADGQALPIELDNDIPTLTAQLDTLPPARYLVDTGDEAFLRLYGPYVAQNKLDRKYPGGLSTLGGGIGGVSAARIARVRRFTLAGLTLRGVPADFSLDAKGGASQITAGSVGSALLSRFVVTFDYPHGRLFLAPGPDALRPFDTRTAGLSLGLTPDKRHIVVMAIRPDAPAQFSDIRVSDEILKVDGVPAMQIGLPSVRRLLSGISGRSSRLLVVQSGNGKPRNIRVPFFDPLPDTFSSSAEAR